ncbi:hypothetical protein SUDANB121_00382 [Nocardiopsis dassonvillei]|uniref:hypothetical protein n=1 Tax=Nocardiopsis dassonvillei TaxID=2014 RepID=UPI003F56C224
MRTLALRGGARIAVVAAEWHDAFCLVTGGRVQLELRDGEPGPVLERGAGFWLRGTGVRALRNPGRRTARVGVITAPGSRGPRIPVTPPRTPMTQRRRNGMNSTKETGTAAAGRTGRPHRLRRLVGTGFTAALAAMRAAVVSWKPGARDDRCGRFGEGEPPS